MSNLLQSWLNNAGRFPLLPTSELLRLAKLRDTCVVGSPQYIKIINKICNHNLRLVPNVVRRYVSKRPSLSMGSEVTCDLLQQGYIGLRRAAEKYDAKRGFTFSTYAYSWVYQSISRWHNSNDRSIYIPENTIVEVLYRKRHGRPSNSKTSRLSEAVLNAARSTMEVATLDRRASEEDDRKLLDVMSDDNRVRSNRNSAAEHDSARLALKEILAECQIEPLVQDIVMLYAKLGRMSSVASRVRKKDTFCREVYEEALAKMQEHAASRKNAVAVRMKHIQPH